MQIPVVIDCRCWQRRWQVEQLVGHEEAACCALWSPNGRNAVTAAADGARARVTSKGQAMGSAYPSRNQSAK